MWLRISIAALQVLSSSASSASSASHGAITRPSDAIVDAAKGAIIHFLSTWRTAWLESTDIQPYGPTEIRLRDVHCHWDGSFGASTGRASVRPPSLIHHSSRRSMCPNWVPAGERAPDDERMQRDVALSPGWRERVRDARTALIDSLATLAERKPRDAWITGQRVRFLVDQGDFNAALQVARACAAERVWCAQLTGYAFHAAGDYARADSAFDAATAAMSTKARCEWTNAKLLLDRRSQDAYDKLSCDERVAANERLWWLSTPLFSDSVDDRRSEHFARKVMVQLHSSLQWDERYDWRSHYGAEAVSDMLIRYGWPALSVFMGAYEEQSHASWMYFYDSTRTATAEYPPDRLHLVPDWRAVADAYRAPADAWQLNMPPLSGDEEPAAQWWPAEHYARAAGGIVQLPDQTVMLRRDSDVLLATASQLASEHSVRDNASRSVLIRSTAPHNVERLPHDIMSNANALVVTARIPATPAIFGTEIPAERNGGLSARTRFGLVPPAPLAAMIRGEKAISDPVLIAAGDDHPRSPEQALSRMLGSTRLRGTKFGVYWETYGYLANDSVDVAVVITRNEKLSKMRRIGMFLRVAHDINGSIAVHWKEPQAGHDSWTIPAIVPTQARSVNIDLSGVEPGHYIVQVQVARRGGLPVSSSRSFVLEEM